jgi:glycosyltransferase involved in cell wall biosynthesis
MATEPEFSIILCTRNRAELLSRALENLRAIDYPAEDVELVLVDNGSTDATREVVERSLARFAYSLRYFYEPKPGLSVARNRGISEARGRFLLFTDDDQLVDPAILREFAKVLANHQARVVQGAIDLEFTESPPAWLRGPLAGYFGKTPAASEGPMKGDLFGGNMLLWRGLFENTQGFREDLGKGALGYCEDTELSGRLRAMGQVVYFAPAAVQRHVIGPERMTSSFIRKTSFEKGLSHGMLLEAGARMLGPGYRAVVEVFKNSLRAVFANLHSDEHARLLAETHALYEVGRLYGFARRVRERVSRRAP